MQANPEYANIIRPNPRIIPTKTIIPKTIVPIHIYCWYTHHASMYVKAIGKKTEISFHEINFFPISLKDFNANPLRFFPLPNL
jgi:hypothetical protein